MGNRAVITASTSRTTGVGVYVHWNGGLESVLAFLHVAKERGYRDPAYDTTYAMARLCGLVCEFFGLKSSTSVGIGQLKELDCNNRDNGVYVIGAGWTIKSRWGEGSDLSKTLEALTTAQRETYDSVVKQLTEGVEVAA